jgi:hypothetical protein
MEEITLKEAEEARKVLIEYLEKNTEQYIDLPRKMKEGSDIAQRYLLYIALINCEIL